MLWTKQSFAFWGVRTRATDEKGGKGEGGGPIALNGDEGGRRFRRFKLGFSSSSRGPRKKKKKKEGKEGAFLADAITTRPPRFCQICLGGKSCVGSALMSVYS